jgi:hypothetical protein
MTPAVSGMLQPSTFSLARSTLVGSGVVYSGKRGRKLKVVYIEHEVERYYGNWPWKLSL